jgi:hypothetical protein
MIDLVILNQGILVSFLSIVEEGFRKFEVLQSLELETFQRSFRSQSVKCNQLTLKPSFLQTGIAIVTSRAATYLAVP